MAINKNNIYKNLAISNIEEEKEGRKKNIFAFNLSLTADQEKVFNKSLKRIINEIGNEDIVDKKDREIVVLKKQVKDLTILLERKKKKGILDNVIKRIFHAS